MAMDVNETYVTVYVCIHPLVLAHWKVVARRRSIATARAWSTHLHTRWHQFTNALQLTNSVRPVIVNASYSGQFLHPNASPGCNSQRINGILKAQTP